MEWASHVIRRVCRSMLQAETLAMVVSVEASQHLRAFLYELHGGEMNKDWERNSASSRQCVWITDCRSLHDVLRNPAGCSAVADKRLAIDLNALQQDLLRANKNVAPEDVSQGEPADGFPSIFHSTDLVCWVDTHVMPADVLTKSMKADVLNELLYTNMLSVRQPHAAALDKLARQTSRAKAKEARRTEVLLDAGM